MAFLHSITTKAHVPITTATITIRVMTNQISIAGSRVVRKDKMTVAVKASNQRISDVFHEVNNSINRKKKKKEGNFAIFVS